MHPIGPDPDKIIPNEKIPSVCFIKNVITRPSSWAITPTTTTSTGPSSLRSTSPTITNFTATS